MRGQTWSRQGDKANLIEKLLCIQRGRDKREAVKGQPWPEVRVGILAGMPGQQPPSAGDSRRLHKGHRASGAASLSHRGNRPWANCQGQDDDRNRSWRKGLAIRITPFSRPEIKARDRPQLGWLKDKVPEPLNFKVSPG